MTDHDREITLEKLKVGVSQLISEELLEHAKLDLDWLIRMHTDTIRLSIHGFLWSEHPAVRPGVYLRLWWRALLSSLIPVYLQDRYLPELRAPELKVVYPLLHKRMSLPEEPHVTMLYGSPSESHPLSSYPAKEPKGPGILPDKPWPRPQPQPEKGGEKMMTSTFAFAPGQHVILTRYSEPIKAVVSTAAQSEGYTVPRYYVEWCSAGEVHGDWVLEYELQENHTNDTPE